MKLRNFVIIVSLLAISSVGMNTNPAIADNCPTSSAFTLAPFTFGLDGDYTSKSPMYQGFISNYSQGLGTVNLYPPLNVLGSNLNATNVALAYLSSGNNQELLKVNSDLSSGNNLQQWHNGDYLKNFTNGSYTYPLAQLGQNLVIKNSFQISNDGISWTIMNFPSDPYWIQEYGFGNGSLVRYEFEISVAGCQNPLVLSTNRITLTGINTVPLSTGDFINHVNSLVGKRPEDVGYFKGDTLSFQFSDFLAHDKFVNGYPNWISSSLKMLQDFDWNSGYFNVHNLDHSWWNLGSNSVNLNVVGIQPVGCLQTSQDDRELIKLIKDCKLGIYVQSAYQGFQKYSQYLLVGTADVRLKLRASAPSPTPSATGKGVSSSVQKKTLSWSCIKGKTILKFSGSAVVCPAGYKLNK